MTYVRNSDKKKDKLSIRIDLEGELLEKFNFLRKHYSIFTATDLVRFLISQEYRRLKGISTN